MTPWSGQFDSAISYFSVSYSPLEAGQAFPHQHGRGIGRKHILLSSVSNITSYFLPIKCQNISSEVCRSQAKSEQMSLCWAVGPGSTGGDEEWVSVPMMLHILPSQILLQRSQTHLQPFPVRSNSLKQETCEEKKSPTPICRYQNRFALAVFVSITIVGVIMRQSCFVSNTEDSCSVTPVTAIITEAVSQPNLAHSSRVWEEVGTRAGVWQPAPGRVMHPFTPYHMAVPAKPFVWQEKLQWQEQAASVWQEWIRERTGWLAKTEMLKAVFLWYLMWLWWKNQWPLPCC